jgi:alkanesulfonate monooxygenase SsuD/methylene tetrahydromethanopterin reductase-like flavin-dependent oxidoreductase (luciferase family)
VRGTLRRDTLRALAVAATVTREIELGAGVLQVPLRNPVELATNLASGGRLRFGVGAGSPAEDFAALGIPGGWKAPVPYIRIVPQPR